eukprot:symbB.v1.2.018468.t1/scaffold1468.1/size117071/4
MALSLPLGLAGVHEADQPLERRRSKTVAEQAKLALQAIETQASTPRKPAVDVLKELALKVKCSSALRAWFHFFDKDQNYRIDVREFDKGLKEMKFSGGKEECLQLWQELFQDTWHDMNDETICHKRIYAMLMSPLSPWCKFSTLSLLFAVINLPCAVCTSCEADFEASKEDFMAYSIFPFKITPGQPLPQAALWFFEMEADPFVIQLKKYMEWAHKMLTACLTVGGQVWEVRLRYNASVWFEETLQELKMLGVVASLRRNSMKFTPPFVRPTVASRGMSLESWLQDFSSPILRSTIALRAPPKYSRVGNLWMSSSVSWVLVVVVPLLYAKTSSSIRKSVFQIAMKMNFMLLATTTPIREAFACFQRRRRSIWSTVVREGVPEII